MYAKPLTLLFNDQEITVELGSSIKKEDLYGKKTTTVEKNNLPLEKVLVTPEGEIIKAANSSIVKVDPEGSPIEEIISCSAENLQTASYTSSFKEIRALEKATEQDVATICTESIYPIAQQNLETGYYRTKFTYRDGPKLQDAILIANSAGTSFLLVGETKQPEFIGQAETYEFFDAENEASDNTEDLSFDMF